jgi:hypothetical protein
MARVNTRDESGPYTEDEAVYRLSILSSGLKSTTTSLRETL